MTARVIDLTESSPDVEELHPASRKVAPMAGPLAARQPLSNVQNGSRANAMPAPNVPPALIKAINSMDAKRVRMYLRQYSQDIPEVRERLTKDVLLQGKDVVRYHRDTDFEDDVNSEIRSSEEEEEEEEEDKDDDDSAPKRVKSSKPITVGDQDFVPRYTKCENCEKEFDVSANDTRECQWHTGDKELNDDDDFWADHDDDCHGDPLSFEDDPDFAEGFKWNCCNNPGDHMGCRMTKHKAPFNVILPVETFQSNKRGAEEEIQRPDFARCAKCGRRYDIDDNDREGCTSHPGEKVIDDESEYWADWDDECHGYPENLIDDPEHADGFMWSCCAGQMNSEGCVKARHQPLASGYRR